MDNLLKIIHILGQNLNEEFTIRQVSKEAKVAYTTTHRLITQNKGIFTIKEKANIKLCSLNTQDPINKNYLILSERQHADLFKGKNPQFKILQKELPKGNYTLTLFGSRSKGTHRKKSDIDICIINKTGKTNIRFSKVELLFDLEINTITLTKQEFQKMLKETEHNLADEILKNHTILHGEEYFWNLILKNDIQKRTI